MGNIAKPKNKVVTADWCWKGNDPFTEAGKRHKKKFKLSKKDKKKMRQFRRNNYSATNFYQSREWLELRYLALQKHGRQCQCCGAVPPRVVLHVDHIKPKSRYPELALVLSNLQILCEACNRGKSNKDDTDFRK